jgi:hypothetical protein
VRALAVRKWFCASFLLILVAIAAETRSKDHAAAAILRLARSATEPRRATTNLHALTDHHLRMCQAWGLAGLGLFGLAVACWVVSRRKRELGPASLLIVAMACYVLWLFVIV